MAKILRKILFSTKTAKFTFSVFGIILNFMVILNGVDIYSTLKEDYKTVLFIRSLIDKNVDKIIVNSDSKNEGFVNEISDVRKIEDILGLFENVKAYRANHDKYSKEGTFTLIKNNRSIELNWRIKENDVAKSIILFYSFAHKVQLKDGNSFLEMATAIESDNSGKMNRVQAQYPASKESDDSAHN